MATAIAIEADKPVGKSLRSDAGGLAVLAGLVLTCPRRI